MLRLTGGQFKGRAIKTPDSKTRPTQSKLRQALFNSLQGLIEGARVLDLYAGSGSLGFEALSRGASHVTFIEISLKTCRLIEENAKILGVVDQCTFICSSLSERYDEKALRMISPPYDLVLSDPPYALLLPTTPLYAWPWESLLSADALVCWESLKKKGEEGPLESAGFLAKIREKEYGDSRLTTYRLVETLRTE